MSKKSNLKRTHRRKTKAYNEAKVTAKHEDVVQQQKAAREAYREARSIKQKRVFTTGAKAVIASAAIMLMFLVGLVSWSAVRNAKQRRDDQNQQEQLPSQMVTPDMVTGMERPTSDSISKRLRFSSFAKTPGGYDGKAMFGGRTSAEGIDGVSEERSRLESDWQERADKRAEQKRNEELSLADKAKGTTDGSQGATNASDGNAQSESSGTDANASRYEVVNSDEGSQDGTTSGSDDKKGKSGNGATGVTDEQIRKLIDSAESTTSR